MPGNKRISRKTFLSLLGVAILSGFIYLWDRIVTTQARITGSGSSWRVKAPVPNGVTFFSDFYLYSSGSIFRAFSTTCTHAGCLLKQEINGQITCPCHGSRFTASSGNPLKGPAYKPLKPMKCRYDRKTGEWIISG